MAQDTGNAQEQHSSSKAPWLREYEFRPGESGNPSGRPKGESITAKLRLLLDAPSPKENGLTIADEIASMVVAEILASNGKQGFNTPLLKELLDRTDGKVDSTLNLKGDVPVTITFIRASPKQIEEG